MPSRDKLRPRLRRARRQALLQLFPGIQAFTLVDVVLVVTYFWTSVDHGFLLAWAGFAALWCGLWWVAAVRTDLSEPWLVGHAAGEGLIFGVLFFQLFPGLALGRAVVLASFATGLIAAGGLCKMTLPSALRTFVGVMVAAALVGLARSAVPDLWVPMLLMTAFGGAVVVLGQVMSQLFDARVEAEEEIDRQKTLVSHMLEDFEESASEGLWETDPEGRVTLISPRLAQLFGVGADDLLGRSLVARSDWGEILGKKVAFRNLMVPVEVGGRRRWWSLSGKPLKDDRGAVTGWRGVGADITGARLQELEVLRLSRYDGLTGLLGRHSFRQHLDELFPLPPTAPVRTLILIDLSGFKDLNEARGHAFGDAVLRAVAVRLRQVLPGTALVARLDSDEFAVLTVAMDLTALLERLADLYEVAGDRVEVTFRVGTAVSPGDADSPDGWLRCSDLALREAKARRQPLATFSTDLMDRYLLRTGLRQDLKAGLDRGEFSLAFQPLVDLATLQVRGFEALLRWTHPLRGLVPPSEFIPLSEENGSILALGLWVLDQACREALTWPRDTTVSVNVSGVQLRDPGFDAAVGRILADRGFAPRRLILEVTESALVKDDRTVVRNLEAVKARGITLALDDFGTGFSSLSYLQTFPFDKLKIDQSFVRAAGPGRAEALLGSIVGLARSLGLSTTAEGIEDQSRLNLLTRLGCDEGQGFLFSQPVAADRVADLLAGPLPRP